MKTFATCLILFASFCLTLSQELRISYQDIDWIPDKEQIVFTAIKVKKDWSDYTSDKWKLFFYDLKSGDLSILEHSSMFFSISPDGKQIAYDKVLDSGKDIFILDMRTGKSMPVVSDSGKDAGPSWSPDGKQLVFYSDRDGKEQLYTIEIESGKTRKLTKNEKYKSYNPVWSRDSNQIVYYLEKGDSGDQIYLTDSKGSFHRNLTNDDHHNIYPSWTPDGRILYVRDQGDIMVMNNDGSNKKKITRGSKGLAKMTDKGDRILMTREDGNLYSFNLDEKKLEKVLDVKRLLKIEVGE